MREGQLTSYIKSPYRAFFGVKKPYREVYEMTAMTFTLSDSGRTDWRIPGIALTTRIGAVKAVLK